MMKRSICTYRTVAGDPTAVERAFLAASGELLRRATASEDTPPAGDGSLLIDLDTDVAHVHFAKQIRMSIGVARRDHSRVVLPVTWYADPGRRTFPRFVGTLEWEPLAHDLGQLTLAGTYDTPMGVVGGAADATLLRNVAHRAAERLTENLARELKAAISGEGVPPAPAPTGRSPLLVGDVMTANPLVVDESLPLRTAALLLHSADISGLPVVAADGGLVGVLSEADLLAKEADVRYGWSHAASVEEMRRLAVTVGEACSRPARTTAPAARLSSAVREMIDHDVSRLVVIGGGQIVGMVTRHDVLAALIRDDRELLREVRLTLDQQGATGVDAVVEWGCVSLRGTVGLRSRAATLSRSISAIDGVAAVDDDGLGWAEDDVLPLTPMTPM
jgi:CBS domain-containing protein